MPYRSCKAGDIVFVRAKVLSGGSNDAFEIRIEDRQLAVTVWVPVREIALAEDIGSLKPIAPASPER